MGKTQRTRMDEDFNSLTTETDANRIALDKLSVTSQAYFKAISMFTDTMLCFLVKCLGMGQSLAWIMRCSTYASQVVGSCFFFFFFLHDSTNSRVKREVQGRMDPPTKSMLEYSRIRQLARGKENDKPQLCRSLIN